MTYQQIMDDPAVQTAAKKIEMARAELIQARRFYGVLVSNVEPVPSRKFPTMATNGKQHFYNPEFINKLSQKKVVGTQVHESEHDARRHHTRRMGRDPVKWNEACDYAINGDIITEGFELPDGFLFEKRFVGMSAEDIYRTREIEQQKQQQDDQQDGDDQQEDQGDQGDDQPQDGDDQGDSEAGDEAGDDAGDQGTESSPDSGEAAGDGDQGEGTEGAPTGEDEPSEAASEAGKGSKTSGDPGGCGEVLDADTDDTEMAEQDMQWDRIVRMAATIGKGDLPGHITREIERANHPGRDWREELRAWLEQGSQRLETWNKRNRRFASGSLILPGSKKEGIRKAVFLIDTSGSMDDIALGCVNVEAQSALDDGIIDEIVVVYGDTRVTRVDQYVAGDEMIFDPRGGGGTHLRPLFDYAANEHEDAALIICFTDMEFGDLGPEPACPVLFAATGYPDKVRRYLANAPWNAPGIDVGAH